MTYQELYDKWANRLLYENDGKFQTGGRIFVHINCDYKLPHLPNYKIKAQVWELPTIHGWRDEKQRHEFYKEVKLISFLGLHLLKTYFYELVLFFKMGQNSFLY